MYNVKVQYIQKLYSLKICIQIVSRKVKEFKRKDRKVVFNRHKNIDKQRCSIFTKTGACNTLYVKFYGDTSLFDRKNKK